MAPLSTLSSLLFTGLAAARVCTNLTIPVDISSRQGLFEDIPAESNTDVAAFVQDFTRNGRNFTQTALKGYQTLTGSYKISAKFCRPDSGAGSTVQLLSHGIGFDKTYWDISYNNYNYSYVETAVAQGYSTLAIDRFGIGNSSHGDAINTVQAQAEVEALNEITTKLRHGQVPEIGCSFEKVIHVGHSFGSVQSQWLSALYPNNTDGLVLTGYSASSKFLPTTAAAWNLHSARLNQPLRFGSQRPNQIFRKYAQYAEGPETIHKIQALLQTVGLNFTTQEVYDEIATTEILNLITGYNKTLTQLDYPKGYMATSGATADQYVFFLPGYYDTGLAIYSERTKQPITYGELLTIGSAPKMSTFTGPVFIITGREDQPFCGGDCFATMDNSTSIPAEAKMGFPAASAFEAYIQPDSGHGINLHYNSTAAYKVILTWLGGHGLGA